MAHRNALHTSLVQNHINAIPFYPFPTMQRPQILFRPLSLAAQLARLDISASSTRAMATTATGRPAATTKTTPTVRRMANELSRFDANPSAPSNRKWEKRPVPEPRTEKISTPASFLKAIGRGCETYASKFADWNRLFTASSAEMERFGIPSKARKYILSWRELYRWVLKTKTTEKQIRVCSNPSDLFPSY